MPDKSPEQRLEHQLKKVSSFQYYNKILNQLDPRTVPFRFISHVVAYLENGEEVYLDRNSLLNESMVYCSDTINSHILHDIGKIKYTRTYINVTELAKCVEKDVEDLYRGRF